MLLPAQVGDGERHRPLDGQVPEHFALHRRQPLSGALEQLAALGKLLGELGRLAVAGLELSVLSLLALALGSPDALLVVQLGVLSVKFARAGEELLGGRWKPSGR